MVCPASIKRFLPALIACLLLVSSQGAIAQGPAERWTRFAQSLERLHQKRLDGMNISTETRVGGYGGIKANQAFYTETRYTDRDTGRLLAVMQRENNPAALLHTIELYVYDEQGRLAREYVAAYLPDRRELPFQTLISVYAYPPGLQSYRQFDASDDLLYEQCMGELDGNEVRIAWNDLEIPDSASEIEDGFMRNAYETCFAALPGTAGPYLDPLHELQ